MHIVTSFRTANALSCNSERWKLVFLRSGTPDQRRQRDGDFPDRRVEDCRWAGKWQCIKGLGARWVKGRSGVALQVCNAKLIRRWDSERELPLQRHRTRTTKYNTLVHKFRNRSTRLCVRTQV